MIYLISLTLGVLIGNVFPYFPVISVLIVSFPSLFYLAKKRYFPAFLCFLTAFLGVFYSVFIYQQFNLSDEEGITGFKGYFVSNRENIHVFKALDGRNIRVYYREIPKENKLYHIECKKLGESKNPYLLSKESFCYATKLIEIGDLNLNIFKKTQEKINRELKAKLDENTSSIMIAMTTGHRHEISQEIREDFQKTGLIHLLSISGAHFSLLFTVFFLIFKTLLRFLPYRVMVNMTLYVKPSQLSIILCFPILLLYFLIVEPNYPSTRAFIMAVFFMLGVLAERKSLWIVTVSFACLFIVLLNPSSAKDLSFQLSFLATIAIGFVSDIYKSFKDKIRSKVLSYFVLSLLISFSASLFTAPLVIYNFHYLSLIAPFANLTAGVLVGMLVFPLNVIFVFIYLITGVYPFPEVINFLTNISLWLMHMLASFSFSSLSIPAIPIGSVLLIYLALLFMIVSFYLLKKTAKKLSLAFAGLLILTVSVGTLILIKSDRDCLKITFLDVKQADSIVIETPKGVFLVDTGKTGFEAEKYLKAKGYKTVQALILTHEQKDHAGGFFRLLEHFKVMEIWDNGYIEYPSIENKVIRHLERGDILTFENCNFTVLHPYKGFFTSSITRGSNELGLVFTLKCYDKTFLFTSDVGIDALESIPVSYLKAEVVKIPHHGSKNSFFEEFYQAVSPQICIISVGKNNPYGHPHQRVIEYLNKVCKVYRTDIDGAIQIREKKNKMEIKTIEESRIKPYKEWDNLKKLFVLW